MSALVTDPTPAAVLAANVRTRASHERDCPRYRQGLLNTMPKDCTCWVEEAAAAIAAHEADKNDAQELARLMYGSPALRLRYCEDHGLLPPVDVRTGKYPPFSCVDEYWRTAIAGEVIMGRHLALAASIAAHEEPHD